MLKFASCFPDEAIVAPVAQQSAWTTICIVLGLPDQRKRDFYLIAAALER